MILSQRVKSILLYPKLFFAMNGNGLLMESADEKYFLPTLYRIAYNFL